MVDELVGERQQEWEAEKVAYHNLGEKTDDA